MAHLRDFDLYDGLVSMLDGMGLPPRFDVVDDSYTYAQRGNADRNWAAEISDRLLLVCLSPRLDRAGFTVWDVPDGWASQRGTMLFPETWFTDDGYPHPARPFDIAQAACLRLDRPGADLGMFAISYEG